MSGEPATSTGRSRFEPFRARWRLTPDGEAFETATSWLLPVRRDDAPLMLKLLKPHSDEADGIIALRHFAGEGAVAVLEAEDPAVLMERAVGQRSLTRMAVGGADDAASTIIAETAARLHRHSRGGARLPKIAALRSRFRALFEGRAAHPILGRCAETAIRLLDVPESEPVVLHGDLHHENVIDSPRGWLAIDPKGVVGEPAYDLANPFLNPAGVTELVLDPARAERMAGLFAGRLDLDRQRILAFAFAHAGLSAAWCIEDGIDPHIAIEAAQMLSTLVA